MLSSTKALCIYFQPCLCLRTCSRERVASKGSALWNQGRRVYDLKASTCGGAKPVKEFNSSDTKVPEDSSRSSRMARTRFVNLRHAASKNHTVTSEAPAPSHEALPKAMSRPPPPTYARERRAEANLRRRTRRRGRRPAPNRALVRFHARRLVWAIRYSLTGTRSLTSGAPSRPGAPYQLP